MSSTLPTLRGQLTSADAVLRFMLAGYATLTLKSLKTGRHLTYRVTKQRDETKPDLAVSVLTDGDKYRFIGFLNPIQLALFPRSPFGPSSPSVVALRYLLRHLNLDATDLPPQLEVYHEGRCGHCGRALTHPESVSTGFGPVCGGRV